MTNRHEDEPVMDWLRNLQRRVERLEKGDKGVRVNDTRLGDQVHTPNTRTNQIEVKNLKTGVMTPIGPREQSWSWSGALTVTEDDDAANTAPVYYVADDTIINEVIISKNPTDLAGCVLLSFMFPGGLDIRVNLADGYPVKIRPVDVAITRNDPIYVRLISVSGGTRNVTATVRFGEPSASADNHTQDESCA